MAPGGTVNLKLEKLCGFTGKSASVIVSVCDIVTNSRTCSAPESLLNTTQAIIGSISPRNQVAVLGRERRRTVVGACAGAEVAISGPSTNAVVAKAPAVVTGCPHLRQNCDPSG